MAERNAGIAPEKRMEFRVGINFGDIIIDGDDMWGDGVNLAARLETLAEPGGICVSGRVQEDVQGKLDITFEDEGERELKNIARPVRVYRVRLEGAGPPAPPLALPDKPSIAVLPFENMSGDPEQEYFADGLTEDIITGLSRQHWFFVIARNSTFTYKGKAVDVREVASQLGVRYVLEGSVRKAANTVRVTGQLIDATQGTHLWAERYDRELADIFELQDEITNQVIGAIEPQILAAEAARVRRKPPHSIDAWDLVMRALPHLWRLSMEEHQEAQQLLRQGDRARPQLCACACHAGMVLYQHVQPRHPPADRRVHRPRARLRQQGGGARRPGSVGPPGARTGPRPPSPSRVGVEPPLARRRPSTPTSRSVTPASATAWRSEASPISDWSRSSSRSGSARGIRSSRSMRRSCVTWRCSRCNATTRRWRYAVPRRRSIRTTPVPGD